MTTPMFLCPSYVDGGEVKDCECGKCEEVIYQRKLNDIKKVLEDKTNSRAKLLKIKSIVSL